MLQRRPDSFAPRPGPLKALLRPPADVGPLDGRQSGGDQSDQLAAAGHVLGVHWHIQHLQFHPHGGQPVDQLQETQGVEAQPLKARSPPRLLRAV